MQRIFWSCCIVFIGALLAPCSSFAFHSDNYSGTWSCGLCHPDGPRYVPECIECHDNATGANYTDTDAPEMTTHFSTAFGDSGQYGEWEQECVDCHNAHGNNGITSRGGVEPSDPSRILVEFTADYAVTVDHVTTMDITSAITVHDPEWEDPATWGAKTGNPERGLVLLDVIRGKTYRYEVLSATADSITFSNEATYFPQAPRSNPQSMKLVYGMLIQDAIGSYQVVYSGPKSMAKDESGTGFDPTPDGICQVCHTQTKYWLSDGSLSDHYSGEKCSHCHDHKQGFKPSCSGCHGNPPTVNSLGGPDGLVNTPEPIGSISSGAHALHALEYGYSCDTCHRDGMQHLVTPIVDDYRLQMGFDIFGFSGNGSVYNGQTLSSSYDYHGTNGTTVDTTGVSTATSCDNLYCHSDGTAVATRFFDPAIFPGPSQSSPAWNGSTACDSCHGYGPDYEHLSPKMNAHARHLSLFYQGGINDNANPCHVCHKNTTTDGMTTNPDFHVNGQYDVVPDTGYVFKQNLQPQNQYNVSFDYSFDPGRSTCSNISCHANLISGDLAWGYGSVSASPHTMRPGDVCGEVEFGISVNPAYPLTSVALPVTFYIDWGDGETLEDTVNSTASPIYSHVYADAFVNHDITWTVRDANRMTLDTTDMTKTNTVTPFTGNTYPTAAFTVSVTGYTVTLTDQSFDLDYNGCGHEGPGRVIIDWGPGGYESHDLDLTDTPSGQQFTHTYSAQPDTHRISYGVYDNVITYPVFLYENVTVPGN